MQPDSRRLVGEVFTLALRDQVHVTLEVRAVDHAERIGTAGSGLGVVATFQGAEVRTPIEVSESDTWADIAEQVSLWMIKERPWGLSTPR